MATASTSKSSKVSANQDIKVTMEDQLKINLFARTNQNLIDVKEEVMEKQKKMQNLDDAVTDVEELCMAEPDAEIPYHIGEVFIRLPEEEITDMLEMEKKFLKEEIDKLNRKVSDHEETLSNLKISLYAKFGSSINLESSD